MREQRDFVGRDEWSATVKRHLRTGHCSMGNLVKRTNVYIDGYNLFFGLLKGTPWKWLDVVQMVKSVLAADHEIAQVYFFTSIVTPYPFVPHVSVRMDQS